MASILAEGRRMATQDAKTLAVRRPVKRKDLLPVEFGDLPAGRTVNWLNPDVVHAILANAVCDCLSICSELRGSRDSRIKNSLRLRLGIRQTTVQARP